MPGAAKYVTEEETRLHGEIAEALIARMRTVPEFIKLTPLAKRVADLMIRESSVVNQDCCFGYMEAKWMAGQLGVSPSTVMRRIKEIHESGLMTTFNDPPYSEYTLGWRQWSCVLDDQP